MVVKKTDEVTITNEDGTQANTRKLREVVENLRSLSNDTRVVGATIEDKASGKVAITQVFPDSKVDSLGVFNETKAEIKDILGGLEKSQKISAGEITQVGIKTNTAPFLKGKENFETPERLGKFGFGVAIDLIEKGGRYSEKSTAPKLPSETPFSDRYFASKQSPEGKQPRTP